MPGTEENLMLLVIDLKNSLSEVLNKVEEVYKDSAYWQHIEYKADNDLYENWLFRARMQIAKVDELLEGK